MKKLLLLLYFPFLLPSCGTDASSTEKQLLLAMDSIAKAESVTQTDPDKLLSSAQIDSIQQHLKNAGIEQMPRMWEMLTEEKGELIVLIPGGGENTRVLLRKDSVYLWKIVRMQEGVEYLIVDYKKTENGYLIKTLHPITWPYSIEKSDHVKELTYGTYSISYTDKTKGLVKWNGPDLSANTIFVDSTFLKSYKVVEEPSPYE